MANPQQIPPSERMTESQDLPSPDALHELRTLLLSPEQVALDSLKERLENPVIRAQEVSRVLPDALALRRKQDTRISQELSPIVEESFTNSIRKRPQVIVDVMAPIIGPAIRKAIARAFRSMVESTNQVLEKSLSWQGLRWRFEAWRTGKPFAEVVLLHTLRYRVEQVFLIHRDSGLLLQHTATESVAIHDESMVSGMLSAIQAFVHDSFEVKPDSNLDLLQIGELTVWIEQSHDALLAAVIRGTPPSTLRTRFQETLETIQIQFGEALAKFQGDTSIFESTQPNLEDCLLSQFTDTKPRSKNFLWIFLGLLSLLIFLWWYPQYQESQRWQHFLRHVNSEPGLTVTEQKKESGRYYISGLQDSLATNPLELLEQSGMNPNRVISNWEPYFSLKADFVQRRALQILKPPTSVHLTVHDGVLSAKGVALETWRNQTRLVAPTMPGVLIYQDDQLVVDYSTPLHALKKSIENTFIYFDRGSVDIPSSMIGKMTHLSSQIQKAQELSALSGSSLHLELIGHSDTTGTESQNHFIRTQRAQAVQSALIRQGVPKDLVSISAQSTPVPLNREDASPQENDLRVSFQVHLS